MKGTSSELSRFKYISDIILKFNTLVLSSARLLFWNFFVKIVQSFPFLSQNRRVDVDPPDEETPFEVNKNHNGCNCHVHEITDSTL